MELVALFSVDPNDPGVNPVEDDLREVDATDPAMVVEVRRRFKKRLNGIINVRTDGQHIYAARRVSANYQWVAYGPVTVAPRD